MSSFGVLLVVFLSLDHAQLITGAINETSPTEGNESGVEDSNEMCNICWYNQNTTNFVKMVDGKEEVQQNIDNCYEDCMPPKICLTSSIIPEQPGYDPLIYIQYSCGNESEICNFHHNQSCAMHVVKYEHATTYDAAPTETDESVVTRTAASTSGGENSFAFEATDNGTTGNSILATGSQDSAISASSLVTLKPATSRGAGTQGDGSTEVHLPVTSPQELYDDENCPICSDALYAEPARCKTDTKATAACPDGERCFGVQLTGTVEITGSNPARNVDVVYTCEELTGISSYCTAGGLPCKGSPKLASKMGEDDITTSFTIPSTGTTEGDVTRPSGGVSITAKHCPICQANPALSICNNNADTVVDCPGEESCYMLEWGTEPTRYVCSEGQPECSKDSGCTRLIIMTTAPAAASSSASTPKNTHPTTPPKGTGVVDAVVDPTSAAVETTIFGLLVLVLFGWIV